MSNSSGTTILGVTFDPEHVDAQVFVEYCIINTIISSVIPLPLASAMIMTGALLFGLVAGLLLNVVTSTVGAYIGLLLTRGMCRPCFERCLGRYRQQWRALDSALVAEGYKIALLIRLAPVAPLVGSNILLSLTSISPWTYVWTSFVGMLPANLPFAYAAKLGLDMYTEFPPSDPVMLTMTLLGFVASILIAWKIGSIARKVLKKHGVNGTRGNVAVSAASAEAEITPSVEGGEALEKNIELVPRGKHAFRTLKEEDTIDSQVPDSPSSSQLRGEG